MLRRITRLLPLLALSLTIGLSSCVKEKDITETEVELEKPKPGEIIMLRGTVRDSLLEIVSNASIRLQMDEFEKDVTTDDEGYFELQIPALKEEALLIADKFDYFKTIQKVNLDEYNVIQDVYLVKDRKTEAANLEINTSNLFRISAQLVDQFNTPPTEVLVYGASILQDEEQVQYMTQVDEYGNFEVLLEQDDFINHFLFLVKIGEGCSNFQNLIYPWDPPVVDSDTLLDWGIVNFPISTKKEFSINVDVDLCQQIGYFNQVYRPGDSYFADLQVGSGRSLSICDTSQTEAWIYNGVLSTDRNSFDGAFMSYSEITAPHSFSLCMPAEKFIEIRFESDTTFLFENIEEIQISNVERALQVLDSSDSYRLEFWGGFGSSNVPVVLRDGNTTYVNFLHHRITRLEKSNAEGEVIFELDPSSPNVVHQISARLNQGVLTAKIRWNDGRTEFITIRYRV